MLKNSFAHMPSIGLSTEKKIWESGISTMDDFLKSSPGFLSLNKQKKIDDCIHLSKEKIKCKDVQYFYNNLPSKEHWRLFKDHQDSTVYLDIETTGLNFDWGIITTIALYDGKTIKYYVNGQNLDDFKNDIQKYKVIITYNGKTFDLPFIENHFRLNLKHAHLDLRYILKSLGYSGGLKSCERQFGIGRTGALADVDGFLAISLWNDYKKNKNEAALETLLSYNIEDVLNLEYLMITAYNKKLQSVPFFQESLNIPQTPENPFKIDRNTVQRVQNSLY